MGKGNVAIDVMMMAFFVVVGLYIGIQIASVDDEYPAECTIFKTQFESEEATAPTLTQDHEECTVTNKMGHILINIPEEYTQVIAKPAEKK